jgi:hypothetical protein
MLDGIFEYHPLEFKLRVGIEYRKSQIFLGSGCDQALVCKLVSALSLYGQRDGNWWMRTLKSMRCLSMWIRYVKLR